MERIINNWTKCYLIGAMSKTKAKDGGAGWRTILQTALDKRRDKEGNPVYIFNPCKSEQNKVGLNPLEYHKKVNGWIDTGYNDKVAEGSDLIWEGKQIIYLDDEDKPFLKVIPGDDFYVENSNFLILRIEPGDQPCGTYYEAGYGRKLKIPIYILQTMKRTDYPESLVGWVFASGGGFFKNQSQLLDFLDEKYELTISNKE